MTAPVITKLTSSSGTGAAALMAALYEHFNTSVSSLFEVDSRATANGSPAGSSGFVITPKGADDFQLVFRRKDTDEIYLSIDPDGDITNSGNTSTSPTGATAETSPEKVGLRCDNSASLRVIVAEWSDRLAILVLDASTNTVHKYGCYVGKIINLLVSADRTGLGLLGYDAILTSASTGWAARSTSAAARLLHMRTGGTQAENWTGTAYVDDQNLPSGVDGDGTISPSALILRSYDLRTQGALKDFYEFGTKHSPQTRVEDSSTGEDVFLYVGSASQGLVMRWPDNTDPTTF